MTTATTLTTTTTFTTVSAQLPLQNSTQAPAPVNRPSGRLKVEGNRTVDLAPINQALGQLTVESLRNQEKILDNITLLFDAVQSLEARNQVLTNENFLLKERLRRVERDNEELSRSFNRFVNVSNITTNAQTTRIDELETNIVRTEMRFDRHHHTRSPSGQTSGPVVPGLKVSELPLMRSSSIFDRSPHNPYDSVGKNPTIPSGQTSAPEIPPPMPSYGFFEEFKATYYQT
jgi:hypothetical protein